MSIWSDINKGKLIAVLVLLILIAVLVQKGGLHFEFKSPDLAMTSEESTESASAATTVDPALVMDPTAETITADFDESRYTRVTPGTITASSSLQGRNMVYSPELTQDDDITTSWQDGVDGYGEGESLTATFETPVPLSAIGVMIGNQNSTNRYNSNTRPKSMKVTVTVDDGKSYDFTLDVLDKMDLQALAFREQLNVTQVVLTINSVYPGEEFEDTCITEIKFLTLQNEEATDTGENGEADNTQNTVSGTAAAE